MLKVTKTGPNRVDLELQGEVDAETMRAGLDDLIDIAQDIENGRILYWIEDFKIPTIGAIGIEITRLPALFKTIRKFERCAVVADPEWMRSVAEFEGKLIPGLEVRGFEPEKAVAAEAWLASDDEA